MGLFHDNYYLGRFDVLRCFFCLFCFFFVVVLFPGFISLLSLCTDHDILSTILCTKRSLKLWRTSGSKERINEANWKSLIKDCHQHKVKCKFINIIIKITPSVSSSLDWARWAGFLRGFHDIFTYVLFNKKNPQKLNNYIKDYMLFTFRPKTPQF